MFQDHIEKKVDPHTRTGNRKDIDLSGVVPQQNSLAEDEDHEAHEVSKPTTSV
jgi:hypothetical protein